MTTAPDAQATQPFPDSTTSSSSDEDMSNMAPISPEVQAIINTPQPPQAAGADDITPPGEPPAAMPPSTENREPEYDDMPQVELRILDKVRAESRTYVLNVGRTVAYANIRIRPRACRKSSPLDDPENASFLQIWEVKPDQTSAWIFSGWMFASSPSLSGMDHPVYDVTVLDCKDPEGAARAAASSATATTNESAPSASVKAEASDAETNAGASTEESSAAPKSE